MAASTKILIVEYEVIIAVDLKLILSDLGYNSICIALRSDETLELIDSHNFDFVVLEININSDFSYKVADILESKNIPFTYCSGNKSERPQDKSRPLLLKPYGKNDIINIMNSMGVSC
jgi:two-component SAPR family response regulator